MLGSPYLRKYFMKQAHSLSWNYMWMHKRWKVECFFAWLFVFLSTWIFILCMFVLCRYIAPYCFVVILWFKEFIKQFHVPSHSHRVMKQRKKPIIQFWYCENVIIVRTFSWLRIVIFTAKKSFFCRAMVFFFLFAIFCSSLRKNGGLIGRLLSKVTFKYLYNGKQNWIAMILGQERNCLDCIEIFDSLFLLRLARLATGTGILVYNFSILRSIHQICCCYKAWNARIKKTLQQFKGHWF